MMTLLVRSGEMNSGEEDAGEIDSIEAYEGVGVSKRTEWEPIVLFVLGVAVVVAVVVVVLVVFEE